MRPLGRLGVLAALALLTTCSAGPTSRPVATTPAGRAFYYWRTTFALSPTEESALTDLHVTRLYVRMFDIAWDEAERKPTTLGAVTLGQGARVPDGSEVVPVVFVRNEVFRHITDARVDELARATWASVARQIRTLGVAAPRELQLDCDWTEATRDAFFHFVTALRGDAHTGAHDAPPLVLSATIRLHQVKYRERTGVPPIDRGMLMFYNMGTIDAEPDTHAIFDAQSASRYLERVGDYPLPLDVALPIWSWTVHVRDDVVVGLLQSSDPAELPTVPFLKPLDANRFVATRDAFLHGTLLREGDVLKAEITGPRQALAAARLVAPHLAPPTEPRTVTLFDLSEKNLTRHGVDKLAEVFDAVH